MNIACFTRDNFPVINMINCLACARCDLHDKNTDQFYDQRRAAPLVKSWI